MLPDLRDSDISPYEEDASTGTIASWVTVGMISYMMFILVIAVVVQSHRNGLSHPRAMQLINDAFHYLDIPIAVVKYVPNASPNHGHDSNVLPSFPNCYTASADLLGSLQALGHRRGHGGSPLDE
jgi:hypothetical protein